MLSNIRCDGRHGCCANKTDYHSTIVDKTTAQPLTPSSGSVAFGRQFRGILPVLMASILSRPITSGQDICEVPGRQLRGISPALVAITTLPHPVTTGGQDIRQVPDNDIFYQAP